MSATVIILPLIYRPAPPGVDFAQQMVDHADVNITSLVLVRAMRQVCDPLDVTRRSTPQ